MLLATERLDETFGEVRRLTGFDITAPRARHNVSTGPDVEVPPTVAREIERRYAEDFEHHGAALA